MGLYESIPIQSFSGNFIYNKLFYLYKILKQYGSGLQGSDGDSPVDTKSLKSQKSFTSYTEPGSLEAELQTWKEQLQLSENTRLTLSSDLLQYQDENKQLSSKLNKLKKDRELQEEKLKNIVFKLYFRIFYLNDFFISNKLLSQTNQKA